MKVKIDFLDRKNSLYKCDMCNKEIHNRDKVDLYEHKPGMSYPKKKYDLCQRCHKILIKAIEKKAGRC